MDPKLVNGKLEFDRVYRSGPTLSNADVHAGGILFGVVTRECLEFSREGKVRIWKEVIDAFWQMDKDADKLGRQSETVSFRLNERGYIEFTVNDSYYYGSLCPNQGDLLAFSVMSKSNSWFSYGAAYEIIRSA